MEAETIFNTRTKEPIMSKLPALAIMGHDGSDEYVAALYESSAADDDYSAIFALYRETVATEYDVTHAAGYAETAQRLAEEIEVEDYLNDLQAQQDRAWEHGVR